MQLKFLSKIFTCFLFISFLAVKTEAQVTTATLNGSVKDAKGAGLAAATVTIEFADAGFKLKLSTNSEGRFTVPNLRVGGPYSVSAEHVSFTKSSVSNLFLELGFNNSVEVKMTDDVKALTGVTVAAK